MMKIIKCVAIFSSLLICACAGTSKKDNADSAAAEMSDIDLSRMGVVLPLSGKDAESVAGAEILSGMQIALAEINANGGVNSKPIKLEIRDSKVKDFAFAETLEYMSSKGVKCFHVGLNDAMVVQHKIFERLDDCFFNMITTYPPATTSAKNATRIFINGAQEGDMLTEKIEVLDRKQCYVVMNVDTLCGRSNSGYFCFNLNRGTAKAYTDVFKSGEKNFKIFSSQIIRLNPRFVFYIGDGTELNDFSESVLSSGYDGVLLATCGLVPFETIRAEKSLRFGKIRTAYELGKVANPVSEKFKEAYKNKFGKYPSWLAAYGYDSVVLFSKSASEGKVNSASMRKFFTNKTYDGAIGNIKFDSCADTLSELEIVEIK